MKSVGIGIGDKLVSLHQLGKELVRCTNENHKTLMDGLSAVELAIKQLAPVKCTHATSTGDEWFGNAPATGDGWFANDACVPGSTIGSCSATSIRGTSSVQSRTQASRLRQCRPEGLESCCSRWPRAVPCQGCVAEPDQSRRYTATGLGPRIGNLVIGVYRHRILPDSFIADAEPYPNL